MSIVRYWFMAVEEAFARGTLGVDRPAVNMFSMDDRFTVVPAAVLTVFPALSENLSCPHCAP